MNIKTIVKVVYGFFAAAFLIVGTTAFAVGTGLLPEPLHGAIMVVGRGDPTRFTSFRSLERSSSSSV